MAIKYTKRLSVDISEEQSLGLDRYLEHGMKKQIFHLLIDNLLELFEKHGAAIVIGALMTKVIGVKEVAKLNLEE